MKSIYIILTTIIVSSLAKSAFCQSESYSAYQQRIKAIDRQVVDLTAPGDLFSVSNFVALYANPKVYLSNAMQYLGDVTNNDENKMIVVYSLQGLPLDDYVVYERKLLLLAEAGSLSKATLNRAIFPALEWNIQIQMDFESPNVKELLREFIDSDLVIKENKEYFKEVRSGKAKQDLVELQQDGLLPKRPDRTP